MVFKLQNESSGRTGGTLFVWLERAQKWVPQKCCFEDDITQEIVTVFLCESPARSALGGPYLAEKRYSNQIKRE